ncbi:MAG TPA: VOC family protein [Gaiellaceae bacterium]|nr:VOC family protein [Gaiellaceae bacterium]
MPVLGMDHVGVIVDDLQAAVAFFVALGLELDGSGTIDGEWVDRIVGLEGVANEFAYLRTPDGQGALELIKFNAPPVEDGNPGAPANTTGLRHVAFAVDDIDATVARLQTHGAALVGEVVQYESSYRLCYLRGPEGIIVELAQKID